jgi:hypothetical protein
LIIDYLAALSGRPKTAETVARFVSDPRLIEHIRDVEAAFPSHELIAEEMTRSAIWWPCEDSSAACSAARLPGSRPPEKPYRRASS